MVKKCILLVLSLALVFTGCMIPVNAKNGEEDVPYVIDFSLASPIIEDEFIPNDSRASGLIVYYSLGLTKTGTTLNISAKTYCTSEVVKCGFKNLVVERKKSTSSTWSEYYDFGNVYVETNAASLSTTLSVASGYQYRLSCKHYAKKSLLVTESISNTSNIVAV